MSVVRVAGNSRLRAAVMPGSSLKSLCPAISFNTLALARAATRPSSLPADERIAPRSAGSNASTDLNTRGGDSWRAEWPLIDQF